MICEQGRNSGGGLPFHKFADRGPLRIWPRIARKNPALRPGSYRSLFHPLGRGERPRRQLQGLATTPTATLRVPGLRA